MTGFTGHNDQFIGLDILHMLRGTGHKNITICGAGAVGSHLAMEFAKRAIGDITVIDFDKVEVENIGTQIYGYGDIGLPKVNALRTRIYNDTHIGITVHNKRLNKKTAKKFLRGADIIIDCFDNRQSRLDVMYYAPKTCKILHIGLGADYGQIMWDEDYVVPQPRSEDDEAVCDYPLSRTLILITVQVGIKTILDYLITGKMTSWDMTVNDLKVAPV